LSDISAMVKSKRVGAGIMYAILLFLAMLAIFDTQVLAIFKRRKEIGTLMALGMTRLQVIFLFTLEGAMHGILAIGIAAIYGIPLLLYSAKHGISFPTETVDDYGFAFAETLLPSYSVFLVLGTIFIVMTVVTIVSFLPTRKIAKLKPTEALKGKIT
ncbi:FtsX-like permease family protein, partial [bacterium]|nr:FtsX-like permease family protein [bacterium]